MAYADYEVVIGLEIHAQLKTQSKMFCACSTVFGAPDNESTCPTCSGQPGSLPTPNKKAVEYAILMGHALRCQIDPASVFARKQYFYPDMPRGYQISQYERPICREGYVEFYFSGTKRKVRIERAHLEEDAGKSTHHGDYSLINLNRASTPLLEIVSAPDITSPAEAAEYARTMRKILRYLEICDGNLEEGSMRCDCNISIRLKGEKTLGTKVEVKNINSFRFVEKALAFEIERQIDRVESGQKIVQETRLYDIDKNRTFSMRSKEDAADYRYFPDPDLVAIALGAEELQQVRVVELPTDRYERFMQQYDLPSADAEQLTQERQLADYFERAAAGVKNAKLVANWVLSELQRYMNEEKLDVSEPRIRAEALGELIRLIEAGEISGKIAKNIFAEMWHSGKGPSQLVRDSGVKQITDIKQIEFWIEQIILAHPKQVDEFRGGKLKVMDFFLGQVMRLSKGQASPDLVREMFAQKIGAIK